MREKNKSRKIKVILFACIVVIGIAIFLVISYSKNNVLDSNIDKVEKSITELVEDDIDALLRVHVDLSESKIVRMRYDLSDEIHKSLTIKNANEYQQFYDDVKQKGYKFNSTVTEIMESHINDQKKIDNLLCELAEAQKKLEEKDKQLASKDKKIGNLEYQKRIGINIAKKKKNEKIIKSRQKNNR